MTNLTYIFISVLTGGVQVSSFRSVLDMARCIRRTINTKSERIRRRWQQLRYHRWERRWRFYHEWPTKRWWRRWQHRWRRWRWRRRWWGRRWRRWWRRGRPRFVWFNSKQLRDRQVGDGLGRLDHHSSRPYRRHICPVPRHRRKLSKLRLRTRASCRPRGELSEDILY